MINSLCPPLKLRVTEAKGGKVTHPGSPVEATRGFQWNPDTLCPRPALCLQALIVNVSNET